MLKDKHLQQAHTHPSLNADTHPIRNTRKHNHSTEGKIRGDRYRMMLELGLIGSVLRVTIRSTMATAVRPIRCTDSRVACPTVQGTLGLIAPDRDISRNNNHKEVTRRACTVWIEAIRRGWTRFTSRNRGGEGVKKMETEWEWEWDQGWDQVWDSPRPTLTWPLAIISV
jgi:hypothetical protein